MTEEFKLSEKKICVGDVNLGTLNSDLPYYVFPEKDVKEFVKLLKEWEDKKNCGVFTNKRTGERVSSGWFYKEIDKLAGFENE